jgi:hypothetical protein
LARSSLSSRLPVSLSLSESSLLWPSGLRPQGQGTRIQGPPGGFVIQSYSTKLRLSEAFTYIVPKFPSKSYVTVLYGRAAAAVTGGGRARSFKLSAAAVRKVTAAYRASNPPFILLNLQQYAISVPITFHQLTTSFDLLIVW